MRKLVLVLCICFGFSNLLFSQTPINPHWQWGNSFDGNVSSMIKDGDYLYVTGYYQNSSMSMTGLPLVGGTDVYVMKIDTLGNVIWAKSIAGSGNDVSVRIVRNTAGHLFVAGNFTSPSLTTGSSSISNLGSSDIYMAEFDANGNGIALTNYGSAGNDILNDFCLDATGQYYLQKSTELVVYSAASTLLWQKTFSSGSNIHYSTADNAVYVSGLFQGTMTFGSMSISSETGIYGIQPDVFVVKFDVNGNQSWLKNITNSNRAEYNVLSYFDQSSNALYLTFNYTYLASGSVCFIYKVSNTGNAINFASRSSDMVNSISAKGNFVSIVNSGYYDINSMSFTPSGLYVFDITNSANNIIYSPYESQNKAHLFDGINSIYAGRAVNPSTGNYTIGRFGHSELAAVNQQQSAVACGNSPTAALTGSFSGGNGTIQYAWTPSTGLSSTNSLTTTASIAVGTTMNYTLTATDSMGLIAYNYFTVTAPVPTTPPVIIPSSPTLCSGSMTLSTASTGTITWFNAAYPMQTIGSGQTITISAPGDYICSLNNNGCSQNDTITIVQAVNVTIVPSSTSICSGQPIALTASGALNYSWTQNVINGVSFSPSTTETYTVTATDVNGCTNSKTI
nr:hypothetical protein [Chitinophagaceae bacterium]